MNVYHWEDCEISTAICESSSGDGIDCEKGLLNNFLPFVKWTVQTFQISHYGLESLSTEVLYSLLVSRQWAEFFCYQYMSP